MPPRRTRPPKRDSRISLLEIALLLVACLSLLGIIALFIVRIYGFASLVVGFSSNLQSAERYPRERPSTALYPHHRPGQFHP
jgi:hypothetical protein